MFDKEWFQSLLAGLAVVLAAALFVWWVGNDELGLDFGQSFAIVLIAYAAFFMNDLLNDIDKYYDNKRARRKVVEKLDALKKERREFWNSGEV